jgi:hypothetical protein
LSTSYAFKYELQVWNKTSFHQAKANGSTAAVTVDTVLSAE